MGISLGFRKRKKEKARAVVRRAFGVSVGSMLERA